MAEIFVSVIDPETKERCSVPVTSEQMAGFANRKNRTAAQVAEVLLSLFRGLSVPDCLRLLLLHFERRAAYAGMNEYLGKTGDAVCARCSGTGTWVAVGGHGSGVCYQCNGRGVSRAAREIRI
jgi:hypothetical protein